jgi:hypothetical protein
MSDNYNHLYPEFPRMGSFVHDAVENKTVLHTLVQMNNSSSLKPSPMDLQSTNNFPHDAVEIETNLDQPYEDAITPRIESPYLDPFTPLHSVSYKVPNAPMKETKNGSEFPSRQLSFNFHNSDYLDTDTLIHLNDSLTALEQRVSDAFKSEVDFSPLRSFRSGPSGKTVQKARHSLAVLYKRLARTIRRLGFNEHAIVVPDEVRFRSQEDGLPYTPVEAENWRVGDALYDTRAGVWYEREFQNVE